MIRINLLGSERQKARKSFSVDLSAQTSLVCSLVLEHIEDLSFIFREAARVLAPNGRFLIHELHPFRQYQGKKARFQRGEQVTEIPAYIHHISDFVNAASASGLRLVALDERWHPQDQPGKPPRLVSFVFEKQPVTP